MKVALLSASVAAFVGITAVSQAHAWKRGGSVTTWRGTYTGSFSGGCANGTCSRSASVTGPYGHTVSRTGSVTRNGSGSYNYQRTTVGPGGNSVTRSGTVYR